jgi:hypothetical protein
VACALTSAASLIEQAPVPGIMRSVGTPAETIASRRPMRSLADIELASELVPNHRAGPQSWLTQPLAVRDEAADVGRQVALEGE